MSTSHEARRVRGIGFDEAQVEELRRLGVTDEQRKHLSRRMRIIREYVLGDAPLHQVRDRLLKIQAHLSRAKKIVDGLHRVDVPAAKEARGYLSAGAAELDAAATVASVESATDGTIPAVVDVPTLLQILVAVADNALINHAPKKQRRPVAPWRAIDQIVRALEGPNDDASRASAARLEPTRAAGSAFVAVSSIVFDATGVKQKRTRKHRDIADARGDVDRAIRRYLEQQANARRETAQAIPRYAEELDASHPK